MTVKAELLEAVARGDHQAVHTLGWGEVWEDLATGWAPRQGCTLNELGAYLRLLADRDPDDVRAAIAKCAGEWRPVPGEVLAAAQRLAGQSRIDVGRGRHRVDSFEAAVAARAARAAGEPECSCGHWHPEWRADDLDVLRCRRCGGLEQGQVYAAEDLGRAA